MTGVNGRVWRDRSFLLAGAFALLRLVMMGRTGLGDAESYYWTWSRHMDWSYYDHPPMVAWLIRLSTWVGGDTPFWTRFPSAVLFVGVCWLIYLTAEEIFKESEAGFWSLLIFNLSPLFSFGALQMVPDIPAAFFWMLYVHLVVRILNGADELLWYAAGAALGLGLLSKYMLLPLVPSTLLMLWFHKEHRRHLARPHIYLGGLLGLLIFSPVLIWNYAHDFPSFKFHLVSRNQEAHFSLNHMWQFLGGQALYMSPLAWLGLLYVAWKVSSTLLRTGDKTLVPVFWMGVPPLLFFYFIGLWSKTSEPHWAAFGYLTPIMAWGAHLTFHKKEWMKYTVASMVLSGALIAVVYVHTFRPILPLKPKQDITNLLYGWDVVGKAAEDDLASLPGKNDKFLMAHHWVMCSQLEFATKHRHKVFCVNSKTDQFDFFPETVPPTGADFIFVADERFEEPPEQFYLFDRSEKAQKITIFRGGRPVREFQLYRVFGYRGQKTE
ncbi:MAG: glycosyltransferase family 39 protein [Nitrospinae bacterium]|nr:glycosyltransferase family 39 protein [Nitrospinota bacterium]